MQPTGVLQMIQQRTLLLVNPSFPSIFFLNKKRLRIGQDVQKYSKYITKYLNKLHILPNTKKKAVNFFFKSKKKGNNLVSGLVGNNAGGNGMQLLQSGVANGVIRGANSVLFLSISLFNLNSKNEF